MFYEDDLEDALRLGDVVRGYISTKPFLKEPFISSLSAGYTYKVDIELPEYSVVLTPCCSIENARLSLTPLIPVRSSFFRNPYLEEDLTRINRIMKAEESMPPDDWKELTDEVKSERDAEGLSYAVPPLFVYDENDLFKSYTLRSRTLRYYMIDFSNTYTISCPLIKRSEVVTKQETAIINSKVLQLSIRTRAELREKLSWYYFRPPKEDMIVED
ncbi:hypothetical protein ES705_19770 [subsurface metagenome]